MKYLFIICYLCYNILNYFLSTSKSLPLIKECYDSVNKKIQRPWHDYYQRKDVYEYDQNIREEFKSLFRQIQINQIL